MKKDGTIKVKGRSWKIEQFPGGEVTVCLVPKEKFTVLKDEQKIGEFYL